MTQPPHASNRRGGIFHRLLAVFTAGLAGLALGLSMREPQAPTAARTPGGPARAFLIVIAIVAALVLILLAFFEPRLAAAGWLTAFVYISAIPLGSLELMMIHRLTGGRWGASLTPVLQPTALAIPLLAILFVPVLVAIPVLYPWVGGAQAVEPGVTHFYLNVPLFIARSVIAFVGWSVLAVALPRVSGWGGQLLAAFGMLFHVLATTLLGIDWILSAEPVFMSTSFGASLAIMQLLAALAFAARRAPADMPEQAVRDLGGLLLAVTLGITYIDFMAVLVMWYGDLPHKVFWFLQRTYEPWKWVAVAAFAFGSVLPILLLLLSRVRTSLTALRRVTLSTLFGLACYVAWLLAPSFGAWALATAVLAALALGSALLLAAGTGRGVRNNVQSREAGA